MIINEFLPKSSTQKQGVAPFTALQILNFKTFKEDFTGKLFSKSILNSDK